MAPSLHKPWYPVEIYRGRVISQRGRHFRLANTRFKSLREARECADNLEGAWAVILQIRDRLTATRG